MAFRQGIRLSQSELRITTGPTGAQWAIAASLATAATHASMRWVELHPFLVAFWRNSICLLLILPAILPAKAWRITPGALPLHLARGVVNTAAMVLLIMGLARISFAEATALTFAAPAFVVLGGALFLRERPELRHWIAALSGLAGVLVISPPSTDWLGTGGGLVLLSAAFFAATALISRSQTRYADNRSILFYLYVFLTLCCAPLAATVWRMPSTAEFATLTLVSLFALAAHWAAVWSVRLAEASHVAPFDYLRLVWGMLIGLALFGERPDEATLIGISVIALSALIPLFARSSR